MEKEIEERELKELELMNENEDRRFYIYVHIRLDNNTVFYVGKGTGNRAYNMSRGEGTHHDNICKACDCKAVIIKNNLTESQAFRLERKMIEYYVHTLGYGIDIEGYSNYDHKLPHLTNMSWGGEGSSGYKHSEETKREMSEKRKCENNHFYGMHHSEEAKRKMSEKKKGKPSNNRIKVICMTTGETFDSIKEAAIHYNILSSSKICDCCKGKRKHAGKLNGVLLQWKYVEDDYNESKAV